LIKKCITTKQGGEGHKKSPSDKSEGRNIIGKNKGLGLTYLPTHGAWLELAPYRGYTQVYNRQVAKASKGHFPQPFWISDAFKELAQR
jgi:hypothetical protein